MSSTGKLGAPTGLDTGGTVYAGLDHTRDTESIGLIKRDRVTLVAKGTTGVLTSTWANPAAADLIIYRCVLNITTKSDSAATYDIGVAANATTTSATLLDGVDIGTAAAIWDSIDDQGSGGQSVLLMTSSQFVTVDAKSDDTGVVGTFEIHWGIA